MTISYSDQPAVRVTVIGPEASLAALTAAGIYAEVDYSKLTLKNGVQNVPATFFVKTLTDCWCYGDYTLRATVSGVGTE